VHRELIINATKLILRTSLLDRAADSTEDNVHVEELFLTCHSIKLRNDIYDAAMGLGGTSAQCIDLSESLICIELFKQMRSD
jgi:hypothetical protein